MPIASRSSGDERRSQLAGYWMPSWVNAEKPLANPDYTHFTNTGASYVGEMLYNAINAAYDKYKKGFGDHFVMECTLNALLKNADVISLHIPQNKDTIWMINDAFFQKVQKPIFFLNLSRGKIVETSALVGALKSGKVLGAGLDVLEYEKSSFETFFEQELPEDFKYLLSSDKVILTPHVGGWTNESYFKLSNVLADKILEIEE